MWFLSQLSSSLTIRSLKEYGEYYILNVSIQVMVDLSHYVHVNLLQVYPQTSWQIWETRSQSCCIVAVFFLCHIPRVVLTIHDFIMTEDISRSGQDRDREGEREIERGRERER